ncbi:competence protein ComA [Rodentibacter heidelbergensis]|uniref:Competence protein ComA n=1 Tax=Rodentibacter heidelbergensis TaxID=1908258 RepID=A0A1V3I947_9PAST|nr:competence protein ComA [Rodentibacter heidelbergensis]OOF36622.1 competence protein ComA [Rodentibacter heidelbergensis]
MPILHKKQQIIQIGVHQQQNQFQFVWLNGTNQVQSFLLSADKPNIETRLIARLTQDFPQTRFKLRYIGCLLPHLIWSKTFVLPHKLTPQECEQQCRFILQKELPIPFEELWFDYLSTPLKQGFQLEIYAVRRQVAQQAQTAYTGLSLDVLDIAYHAILRTFRFLLGEVQNDALYLYQDQSYCLALSPSSQGIKTRQTQENLTALYHQFCQHFEVEITSVYVYQTPDIAQRDIPQSWQRVTTTFPFIALGNALWQKDLQQNPIDFSTLCLSEKHNEQH